MDPVIIKRESLCENADDEFDEIDHPNLAHLPVAPSYPSSQPLFPTLPSNPVFFKQEKTASKMEQYEGVSDANLHEKKRKLDDNCSLDVGPSSGMVPVKSNPPPVKFPVRDIVEEFKAFSGIPWLSIKAKQNGLMSDEITAMAQTVIENMMQGTSSSTTSPPSKSIDAKPKCDDLKLSSLSSRRKPQKETKHSTGIVQFMDSSPSCMGNSSSMGIPSMVSPGSVIPRKHQCTQCSYSTDNRSHLRRHFTSVHCEDKQFACYVCDREFSRLEKAKNHIIKIHPEVEYDRHKVKKGQVILALEKSDAEKSRPGFPNYPTKPVTETSSATSTSKENTPEPDTSGAPGEAGCSSDGIITQWMDPENASPSNSEQIVKKTPAKSYKDLERKFRCPKCTYVGKDVWHLKRHMNEIHEGLKTFKCSDCEYSTSRKHRMISHMKSHGELKCFYCTFSSADINMFHTHLTECTRIHRSATYRCEFCPETFGIRKSFAKHMLDIHQSVLYLCDECLFLTLDFEEFNMHKQSHEENGGGSMEVEEGEHYCAACNELFPSEDLLQQHVTEVHNGTNTFSAKPQKEESSFSCSMCDFRTTYRFVMKNHIRKHTGEKFKCDFPGCNYQASWKNSIQHHKELKHSPKQNLKCSSCDKIFHHKLNLKMHEKTHDKKHLCPVCGRAFAQLCFLNKHLPKHEQQNNTQHVLDNDGCKAFACDVPGCLFRSKYRNVLKRHVESQHEFAEYPCPVCKKPFKHQDNLAKHIKIHNKTEQCPTCDKLFALRAQLRKHMLYYHNEILQIEYVEETDDEEEEEGKQEDDPIEIIDDIDDTKGAQENKLVAAVNNNNVTKLEGKGDGQIDEEVIQGKKVKEGVDFHYIESLLGNGNTQEQTGVPLRPVSLK